MYPEQSSSPFGKAHPVMLIGILCFILPYINHWSFFSWVPGWFVGVGVLLILVGAALSIDNVANS